MSRPPLCVDQGLTALLKDTTNSCLLSNYLPCSDVIPTLLGFGRREVNENAEMHTL